MIEPDINIFLGFMRATLLMGVEFIGYDNHVMRITVPSNFSKVSDYKEIQSNVAKLRELWVCCLDLSDDFRMAFTVRNDIWSDDRARKLQKSINGNGVKSYILPIVPFMQKVYPSIK